MTDDEGRSLRPIGMSLCEAAAYTGLLLDRFAGAPGVRLYDGIRVTERGPRVGFAVMTDARVLLVESVAWPAGTYTVTPEGCVLCDGVYFGQSVRSLLASVRLLRRMSRRRQIGAVVVVHPAGGGTPSLPALSPAGPAWLSPGAVGPYIARRLLLRNRRPSLLSQ
ncbi:hypothetical protein AB0J83_39700 [Actinoplanes sp. NPDC049596]|uniref:hypothetical protein n=1 Tax=unclassified Actinoplanes TaxID=2626549 RepID=UPI003412BB65